MPALLQKSKQLTAFLLFILQELNDKRQQPVFKILTPIEAAEHGCQLSILVQKNGKALFDELGRNGVFADWREPDVIRVAPVPLYNTFEEVWRFGSILEQALTTMP